jgi:hypothetical protein
MVDRFVVVVGTHTIGKEVQWFGMIRTYAISDSRLSLLASKDPLQKMKISLS